MRVKDQGSISRTFLEQSVLVSLNEGWGTIFLHKWPVFIIILVIWWVSHGSSSMTGSGIMFREHAMLKNHYSARCNTMIDSASTNLFTHIPVTTQGHRKLLLVQSQQIICHNQPRGSNCRDVSRVMHVRQDFKARCNFLQFYIEINVLNKKGLNSFECKQ